MNRYSSCMVLPATQDKNASGVRRYGVLFFGPGRNVRGGISSVLALYEQCRIWRERNCRWIETHDDRSWLRKIIAATRAYILAPIGILQADVVHIHCAAAVSFLRKLPILGLARCLRRPAVLHLHVQPKVLFERTPGWALTLGFRLADRVIALSAEGASLLASRVDDERIF